MYYSIIIIICVRKITKYSEYRYSRYFVIFRTQILIIIEHSI